MAFSEKYSLVSQEALRDFSKSLTDQLQAYTSQGIGEEVEAYLTDVKASMSVYVPVDTSATKDSWFQMVEVESGKVTGYFGHDENGNLDYVPFIYLGLDTEENPITFRNGRIPYWLEPAAMENLDKLKSKLSKRGGA
jgi:hypothetical protein